MADSKALEKIFDKIKKERGGLAAIHSEMAAFPEGVEAHYEFYKKILLNEGLPLSRMEAEFLAVKTSEANVCEYCISHHKAALEKYDGEITKERRDFFTDFAATSTKEPWKTYHYLDKAKELGISREEYSHAVMIVSYFNMANRIVYAMGLELEEDFTKSCN